MERYQKIVRNKRFQREYQRLEEKEQDRRFCRHNMEHFLAAARICYIIVLEKQLEISKDVIYGTAFLHDLGRMAEYETGKSHEEAGADLQRKFSRSADMSRGRLNRLQTPSEAIAGRDRKIRTVLPMFFIRRINCRETASTAE